MKYFVITHIPQSENRQADALSKLVSSFEDGKPKTSNGRPYWRGASIPMKYCGWIGA